MAELTAGRLSQALGGAKAGSQWMARCPAHDDSKASLSISEKNGKVLFHCHAGCPPAEVIAKLGELGLWREQTDGRRAARQRGSNSSNSVPYTGLTVDQYAAAKKLDAAFVRDCGLRDHKYQGAAALRIAYLDPHRSEVAVRFRLALDGADRFRWKSGAKPCLYGLWRLDEARRSGWVVLVEGESDCHTLWSQGIHALGLPGASAWNEARDARHLDGLATIYVVIEPDRGGEAVKRWLACSRIRPRVRLLRLDHGKDPSEVYLADPSNFSSAWQAAIGAAIPWTEPPESQNEAGPYRETDGGIVWLRDTREGVVETPLTNFTARIVAELIRDDGAERSMHFEIWARLSTRESRFLVPAQAFHSMRWATEELGARAIVEPGFGKADHARAAIQKLSREIDRRTIFTHSGWRQIDNRWIYLHAGGAIGGTGSIAGVEVELPAPLQHLALPDPPEGDACREAVRASLAMLDLGPAEIMVPVLGAVRRAVLRTSDFSIFLVGPTGVFKSELAALAQCHFGASFDARHLPASWTSTANANEATAFVAKDALLVVDDFKPGGSAVDRERAHREADRLLRAQGNLSGRSRLNRDATARPAKPPRCLILATGEELPRGESLRARLLAVEVGQGDIDSARLTECQRRAAAGQYSQATAAFLKWLAPQLDMLREKFKSDLPDLRARFERSGHRRTLDIVLQLSWAWGLFLRFAQEIGSIDEAQCKNLSTRIEGALIGLAEAQAEHQVAQDPAPRFLELLNSAFVSGSAHLANLEGSAPCGYEAPCGWRKVSIGTGDYQRQEWRPQGDRVGWIDGEKVFLDPEASYRAAQRMSADGDGIGVSAQTLRKRLHQASYLASTDPNRKTLKVRKMIEGRRQDVLHLHARALGLSTSEKPVQPDQTPDSGAIR